MYTYLSAILILTLGAISCLFLGRRAIANVVGATAAALAGAAGLIAGLSALAGQTWDHPQAWSVPMGSLHVGLDALSGFFVAIISLVAALAGVYGRGYMAAYVGRKNVGASWAFYLVLMASMILVVSARNAVLFLVAWEVMSLSSFFLVMFEHERPEVLEAGWTYLIATHLGTAFLLAMFLLLGHGGSLDFADMSAAGPSAGAIFLLAVIGFGTKAGFVPMHVWLPEAHPAAPSHVSAVMSGVMIKTGIYGLLRVLMMIGPPPAWWGWTLVGVGATSGILGVLFALAQRDLKRMLAYSTVENVGIISLGLGVGLLGISGGNPAMAVLGLTGGLLHVLNHAIFKGLLFLGAGSVLHAAGSRAIDRMGGLLKRMGGTGATFLVASGAISGLPPFNGFVGEFAIYAGSFSAVAHGVQAGAWAGMIALGSLALIGGLSAACFTRAFGIVFLGEPRSPEAAAAHESPLAMRAPMYALAGLCVLLGLAGPLVAWAIQPAIAPLIPKTLADAAAAQTPPWHLMWWISGGAVVLAAFVAALTALRSRLLRGRTIGAAGTWDCGYVAPTARMQYTGTSFAAPIVGMFCAILRPRERFQGLAALLPPTASVQTGAGDLFTDGGYRPVFRAVGWLAGRMKWMQQGRNQLYVLYVALAVLALLVWKMGVQP